MAVGITDQSENHSKNEVVCIPTDLLQSLLESNAKQHEALIQMTKSMEKIVTEFSNAVKDNERLRQHCASLDTSSDHVGNHTTAASNDEFQHQLLGKLDVLCRTITPNPKTSKSTDPTDRRLKQTVRRRKTLLSKIRRAEQLSKYYIELTDRADPFVPRKFRSKVNISTPEDEKYLHKDLAIYKAKSEANLMKLRMEDWKSQLVNLESEIDSTTSSFEDSKRKEFYSRLSKDADRVYRNRTKSFEKLRRSYEAEINSVADKELFLLTYVYDRRNDGRQGAYRQGWNNPALNGRWEWF